MTDIKEKKRKIAVEIDNKTESGSCCERSDVFELTADV